MCIPLSLSAFDLLERMCACMRQRSEFQVRLLQFESSRTKPFVLESRLAQYVNTKQ